MYKETSRKIREGIKLHSGALRFLKLSSRYVENASMICRGSQEGLLGLKMKFGKLNRDDPPDLRHDFLKINLPVFEKSKGTAYILSAFQIQ